MSKKAVVLCSGGLDSTTCLAVAQSQGYDIYALSFDYGQRNKAELNAVKRQAEQFNANQHMIQPLNLRTMGHSALTDDSIDVPDYSGDGEIPATYVPARNTMFLSIALGWAEVLDADAIFIGVSHVDFSGYPDCRPEYIQAFQTMANLATKRGVEGHPIKIITPIINLSKADTIKLGISLGVDYSQTVTCYAATDNGEACGRCDSCVLRKQGFEQAQIADPTMYV
ncbi:MAG: 7-cyano-7-deazaguanine synthase QueC [Coxiellaceae bacterium]|nr:7-cyano-7-deazaguanine synthase QueC [Coxiellaceae bacterium]